MTLSGRFEPHPGDELQTYAAYLAGHRAVLRAKCDGLSPEQLTASALPPSDLSLHGLVRHLARVEHGWFRRVLDAHLDEPRLDTDDPTGGFHRVEPTRECVDACFASWEQQIAYADECLARLRGTDLGERRRLDGDPAGEVTVRDVLVHLVEEYARHNGHADLLRDAVTFR